jgi:hypothetical protein
MGCGTLRRFLMIMTRKETGEVAMPCFLCGNEYWTVKQEK